MAYKFTGRIKSLGCGEQGKNNFCEFDVDNTIKISDKECGVAYDDNNNLRIVPKFSGIDKSIFNVLLSCKNERFEIGYIDENEGENGNDGEGKNKKDTIIKVTVLK